MKKRILMLFVVVGVLLSICGAAWADKYGLLSASAAYSKKYNVNATAGTKLTIPIQALIDRKSDAQAPENYVANTSVSFTFDGWQGVLSGEPTTSPAGDISFGTGTDFTFDDYSAAYPETRMHVIAKGTGTVTVTATLGTTSKQATIYFSTSSGMDEINSQYKATDGPNDIVPVVKPGTSPLKDTVADPDHASWDGIDPPFGAANLSGTTYKGDGTNKPKINTSKVETNKTYTVPKGKNGATEEKKLNYFTSGIADNFTIEIQGPNPYVDVYVAAKDAVKLWPLSCDQKLNKALTAKWDEDIHLNSADIKKWKIPFRVVATSIDVSDGQGKTTKHTVTIAFNGAQVAYKGFPLTISAANDKTLNRGAQKPVTKAFKIDVKSVREVPQWVTATGETGEELSKKNSLEVTVPLHAKAANGKLPGVIYTVSADGPYYITAKGDKDGISTDVTQPVLNRFGEVETAGYVKLYGVFNEAKTTDNKGNDKEDKVAVTLDAVGSVKKTSFKANVVGKVSPYFEAKNLVSGDSSYAGMNNSNGTYNGYYKQGVKTAEAGKAPTVKIAAKGSKTITYSIEPEQEAELNKYNMAFDSAKGQVIALLSTDNKTKLKPLATISDDDYAPVELTVTADNSTGITTPVKVLAGVTGEKAKPFLGKDSSNKEIKTLKIAKSAAVGTLIPIGANVGKEKNGTASSDKTAKVLFWAADAKKAKEDGEELEQGEDSYALDQLGLELMDYSTLPTTASQDEYRNFGLLKVGSEGIKKATKGQKINLILSNFGNEQKGTVTIAILDPKPVIVGSGDTVLLTGSMDIAVLSKDTSSASKKFRLKLTDATKPTDDAKVEWKIADDVASAIKTANFKTVTVKALSDSSQADLEIKTATGAGSNVIATLTVTAKNKNNNETSEKFTVRIIVNSADLTSGATAAGGTIKKKAKSDKAAIRSISDVASGRRAGSGAGYEAIAEGEADEESAEEVIFGAPRSAADLTAAQRAFIAAKGYIVVAVLPEITAKAEGQQDIEVELDESAPEGAKLVWLPFPKDAGSEDDDIVDFYDEAGALVEGVPASHKIIASPWLREGVTYAPVIAIEAK